MALVKPDGINQFRMALRGFRAKVARNPKINEKFKADFDQSIKDFDDAVKELRDVTARVHSVS